MKLRQQNSTQPQIFEGGYQHPWYEHLKKPNPPSQEAVEKAKFIDKTYKWSGTDSVRSRDKRSDQ